MPELLDYSEFCQDLREVTSTKIFDRKKFNPDGLFSEQIFGPVNNYTCQCGTYYGISKSGGTCDVCGVDIVNSRLRRERFAKISLPINIVNPIFYDLVVHLGGNKVKSMLDSLMKDENTILCKDGEELKLFDNQSDAAKYSERWEGLTAIYNLVKTIANDGYDVPEWKMVYDNLDKLLIHDIIVLPPELRPTSVKANVNEVDEINRYYMQILMKKSVIDNTTVDITRDKKLFYQYFRQIQKNVDDLYKKILSKLSKKEGLIRGNILGKRIDFSGRAVITPDPTIPLDTCIVPYVIFLELYKLEIAKKLIELERYKLLNNALDYIDECISTEDPSLIDVCEEVNNEGKTCLLNRQPSLHRLSMLGFYMKISFDKVIKIHPLVCPPLNADYDGDVIAIYAPISDDTIKEVEAKFLTTKNLANPANDTLAMTPGQDVVLGIYFLTTNKFNSLSNMVTYKDNQLTESMKIFNECLPDDYPVINYPVAKKELNNILDDIRRNYPVDVAVDVLDNVKKIGFKYSSLYGATLSLDLCEIEGSEEIKNEIYSSENVIDQLNKLNEDKVQRIMEENFNYSYMVDSGARGKWDQIKQVVFTRGFISNFKGQILPTPIKNSLLDGLTREEFFNSTYGCRKGLMDVAINTGTSGYLSRKLNMAMMNLQLNENLDDCGTKDCFELYIKNNYHAEMLVHRYYVDDNGNLGKITYDNYKDFVGSTIRLRSPLFCQSNELCKTCYGDLYNIIKSRFVGIVSAQSLGESNTQMVLRTFHSSLRENTEVTDINGNIYPICEVYDLIKDGKDFYTFSCSPEGRIEVSKVIDAHKDRFEKKFVRATLDNGEIVECTLDHEWIMRNGSHKEAKDLNIGDSIMPLYYIVEIKITNIEIVELDDYEEFYDLTVESKHSNFALASGIFIHNSGVANIGNTEEPTKELLQQDIVADLSTTSKLMHSDAKNHDYKELVTSLFEIYNHSKKIHYVHFECLISQMMWYGDTKWRLCDNRNSKVPEHVSVQSVPTMESWLLGLAFASPRKHILEGVLYVDSYKGIVDKLLCGEKLN